MNQNGHLSVLDSICFKQNKVLKWISFPMYQNYFLAEKPEAWGEVVLRSQLRSCHWWCNHVLKDCCVVISSDHE